ncbi:MAG: BamA/TamA family outer membrane protein [Elusimicrobiota bacterium]
MTRSLFLAAAVIGALSARSPSWAGADAAPASTTTFSSVLIEGAPSLPRSRVDAAVAVHAGDPYEPAKVDFATESLLSLLQNSGYLEASVESRVVRREGAFELTLRSTEGPLYRFGETRIEGLSAVKEKHVRRELPYRPGDPYERPLLFTAQSRLYGLGFFEDLSIRASTTAAKTAEVLIGLQEKPMKSVNTGVGYGSEEQERFSARLTHGNFLGRAYRTEFGALYSRIWLEYRGEFVNRHLLGTDIENRLQASWRREDRRGYDIERAGGQCSLGRALPYRLRGTFLYKLQRSALFNLNPETAASARRHDLASSVALLANRDTTDDPFFPTKGALLQGRIERSGGVLGGDVHLNRASLEASRYWTPWKRLTAAFSARAGVVRQFGRASEVPVYERFFMGGANTVRGYRERGVGPVDSLGAPLGGNVMTGANAELRFPLAWRFWGAVFVDGGQVAAHEDLAVPGQWRYGTGFGLRLRTPVGPLRLDAGYKLSRQPADGSDWRVHFSLGEAF